jgi:hypothetical protein
MPEARASGIFVNRPALASGNVAFDLLTLEEQLQHGNT